jgi:hypothetical protein
MLAFAGCEATPTATQDGFIAAQDAHRGAFSDFDLPRKIGAVENLGLQLPSVSPDGTRLAYLRSDQETVSPMTVLASAAPEDTPPTGLLSVWVRGLEGSALGARVSRGRWCHSAVWSPDGSNIVYVSNEPNGSSIGIAWISTANLDATSDDSNDWLGVPERVNILPRFARDGQSVIFCSADASNSTFRVCRQRPGEAPVAISPAGQDCVLPALLRDDGWVVCGQIEGGQLNWVQARPERVVQIAADSGSNAGLLQTWAGIGEPLAPDGSGLLYYDPRQNRIAVLDIHAGLVRLHRPGSIAACWMTPRAIALATPDNLFCVDVHTGVSIPLMSGAWIPARYLAHENRLVLFGKEGSASRLSIFSMNFRPRRETVADKQ